MGFIPCDGKEGTSLRASEKDSCSSDNWNDLLMMMEGGDSDGKEGTVMGRRGQ